MTSTDKTRPSRLTPTGIRDHHTSNHEMGI